LDNGDLDRTHRQQAFLASVAQKLRSAGTFTDLGKLRQLIDTAKKDAVISAGWDILPFAGQAKNLTGGNLEFLTLPIEGYDQANGQEVNKVDVGKVRAAVRTAFGLGTPLSPHRPRPCPTRRRPSMSATPPAAPDWLRSSRKPWPRMGSPPAT
jgi:anionic cell wall polymer biosynthesis LytR-Cps2A-Psr (LCP) family protein